MQGNDREKVTNPAKSASAPMGSTTMAAFMRSLFRSWPSTRSGFAPALSRQKIAVSGGGKQYPNEGETHRSILLMNDNRGTL